MVMSYIPKHRLLERQLNKVRTNNGVDVNALLELVDHAYEESDREKRITNRALNLMTSELTETNTFLRNQRDQLKRYQERFELATLASNDGIWDWFLETGECFYSARWKEMLGYDKDHVFSNIDDWLERIHPDQRKNVRTLFHKHLAGMTERFVAQYQILCKDNHYLWVSCHGFALRDESGTPVRIAGSQTDISQKKTQEEELYQFAFYDKLTGLPNRVLFIDRLDQTLKLLKRVKNRTFALLFMDLDRFKLVNDSLGHEAGDELLKEVSRRINDIVRPTDTVARLAGDEFTVLLTDLHSPTQAHEIATRILESINKPFYIYGQNLYISCSIGIEILSPKLTDSELVLRNADVAMYSAKNKGKGCVVLFKQEQHEKMVNVLHVHTDLRSAIDQGKIVVFYQPIMDLKTKQVRGLEALVRWKESETHIITPGSFIQIAEETGLILPLGSLVVEGVCQKFKDLEKTFSPEDLPFISINVSLKQFSEPKHIKSLVHQIRDSGLPPCLFKFEVTESVIMDNPKKISKELYYLKENGFSLSIDDFGTGYSSLSYLHNLPFDDLKIDRSFISRITTDPKSFTVVNSIIGLAQDLGLTTIAEGISSEEELLILESQGCSMAQGYYFSQPLPSEKVLGLLSPDKLATHPKVG